MIHQNKSRENPYHCECLQAIKVHVSVCDLMPNPHSLFVKHTDETSLVTTTMSVVLCSSCKSHKQLTLASPALYVCTIIIPKFTSERPVVCAL